MSDFYQLITIAGVKEDSNEILHTLENICSGKLTNDLRLVNYFQEVPVSYPAEIQHVQDDMVDLTVHQHQAVVMQQEKITFLKSQHLRQDVIAKVFRADPNRCLAILSMFAYAQIRAERRQFVRVKLGGEFPVSFFSPSGELKGRLEDISIGGMCISVHRGANFDPQTKGLLKVILGNYLLDIPATMLKMFEEEGKTKYVFEFEPDAKIETKVSQFIFQRQLEIIREIKDSI